LDWIIVVIKIGAKIQSIKKLLHFGFCIFGFLLLFTLNWISLWAFLLQRPAATYSQLHSHLLTLCMSYFGISLF